MHALPVGFYMDVHNKCHITHHQLFVNPYHGLISGQNGMGRRCRRCNCIFSATLSQFPFYLYPNRAYSGPLTVFIDLFAFVIIYVFDSFFFSLSSGLFYYCCTLFFMHHILSYARLRTAIDIFICILYRIYDCNCDALLAYVIHLCRIVDTALFDLLSYFNAINEKQ